MRHVLAAARIYTIVFVVVLLAIELVPGPFFGFAPTAFDKLVRTLPGLALLVLGWAWLLRIRSGAERP